MSGHDDGEALQECPVCSALLERSELPQHVEAHFAAPAAPTASPEQQLVRCSALGCGARVPLEELDAHEASHVRDLQSTGGSCTGGGGDVVNSVLCPLGCGAWIPMTELDSHERQHQALASPHPQPTLPTLPHSQDDRDQQLAAVLAAEGSEAGWGYEEEGAPLEAASEWRDAQLAASVQEAQDFEVLQARFGFSSKRPGRCFACNGDGHWARDWCGGRKWGSCQQIPRNPAAQRNHPRLPSNDPLALASLQRGEPQWLSSGPARRDLIPSLAQCMQTQALPGSQAWLCGSVMHVASQGPDRGWGCGWRNIQMQLTHLLLRPSPSPAELFGVAGLLPDIGSLQAWLETAWKAGYDVVGAESLGNAVQGHTKWVGTTEAAALLRHQGVAAHIVDFKGPAGGGLTTGPGGATVHEKVQCDGCGQCPLLGVRHTSATRLDYDLCTSCVGKPGAAPHAPYIRSGSDGTPASSSSAQPADPGGAAAAQCRSPEVKRRRKAPGAQQPGVRPGTSGSAKGAAHAPALAQALLQWVWAYFTGQHAPSAHLHSGAAPATWAPATPRPSSTTVFCTGMPPLYFQHEGHSRTIVGVERKPLGAARTGREDRAASGSNQPGGELDLTAWAYALLVLDPSSPPNELSASIQRGSGWQRLLKRGLHTLRRPEYQLLYCGPAAEGVLRSARTPAQPGGAASASVGTDRVIRATEVVCAPAPAVPLA